MGTLGGPDRGPLPELEARYRELAAELAGIGFLARGSVVSATTTCSSKGCHCRLDPARRHGPYWQWTRSLAGTARTRRLSEVEARLYRGWIAERRRVAAILEELEALSLQAAEIILQDADDATPPPRPPRRMKGTP